MDPVLREIATTMVTAADEYVRILDEIESGSEEAFNRARQRAYALALSTGQISCAIFQILSSLREVSPKALRPPPSVPLVLAAISGACAQIAAAPDAESLSSIPLPTALRLHEEIESDRTAGWLTAALALRSS